MIYDNTVHWSNISAAFYVALGLCCLWCICLAKRSEASTGKLPIYKNRFLFVLWATWTFFAVFRLVDWHVGGADAPTYVYYFENCNSVIRTSWFEHAEGDLGFKWINKTLRFIFSDYHFYFLAVYGFMSYAYVAFLNRFSSAYTNFVPYVLGFFLLLRSFNTIRSNLAIAFIVLGCTFILQKKWKWAYIIGFVSIFIHKSSLIYVMCIPFCHVFFNRKMTVKMAIFFILSSCLVGRSLQSVFLHYAATSEMNGAYAAYASHSIGGSFFANAWKIAFEQIALGVAMLVMRNKIGCGHSEFDKHRLKIIWMLCIYDLMTIPINYIIGSWRGYEFFYLARIVMWGEIIYQFVKPLNKKSRWLISSFALILFVAWMVFRISATWSDSRLMPYIFEPFLSL